MELRLVAVAVVLLVGGVLIARRADVRLVLGLTAAALFALAGKFPALFVKLAEEMANPRTVVPICSAMGFAYVLKLTGCDAHLVRLLLRPLQRARWLLIPGGIAVGYLVNTTIVSQSSSAAVVGPILIPLVLAAGYGRVTAGALLLLGCSMGGELFNPGAVEVATLAATAAVDPKQVVARIAPLNLAACGTALLVFWRLTLLRDPARAVEPETAAEDPLAAKAERLHPFKAMVPVLPIALLFIVPAVTRVPEELSGHVSIAAAMLVGVTAAAASAPRLAPQLSGAFFGGAGWAYTNVISLIITATLFAEGLKVNGVIELLVRGMASVPSAMVLASIALPWSLATVGGSGIAPAVATLKALVPAAAAMHLDPLRLGALTAIAAQFGRTMSPVAAVVLMAATLSEADSRDLLKRVVLPLLAGGAVLVLCGLFGVG